MNESKSKVINEETLGEKLKEARERKRINLKDIERITKIQVKYLEALENGRYENLPSDVYTKNFLKVYSQILSLEFEPLFELYKKEKSFFKNLEKENNNLFRTKTKPFITPELVKFSLIGFIAVILLIYLGLGIKGIISPPPLIVDNPKNKLITNQEFVKVEGKTEKEVRVTINDQEVLSNRSGYFEKTIDLQKGLNIIKITAAKKHSRENVIYREVWVE